ncbi:hypothetical protein EDD85DRAFT_793240 [Armillaria nabsnona]|nr:hypothetical protein EDD85DRAFT_793240 [Armillaria nabsnona]
MSTKDGLGKIPSLKPIVQVIHTEAGSFLFSSTKGNMSLTLRTGSYLSTVTVDLDEMGPTGQPRHNHVVISVDKQNSIRRLSKEIVSPDETASGAVRMRLSNILEELVRQKRQCEQEERRQKEKASLANNARHRPARRTGNVVLDVLYSQRRAPWNQMMGLLPWSRRAFLILQLSRLALLTHGPDIPQESADRRKSPQHLQDSGVPRLRWIPRR